MDEPLLDLTPGAAYYRCGCEHRDGIETFTVSTWIYVGVIKHSSSCTECDRPFHFYKFVELESCRNQSPHPNVALIPSLKQVTLVMLDLATLMDDVAFWGNRLLGDASTSSRKPEANEDGG